MELKKIDVSVISDLHLATHACKAKAVLRYLKSIEPEKLILNGDIIDSWRFSRSYFPKSHLKVIRQIIKMMEKGVKVIYITGNHDDFMRKFDKVELGNLSIVNQYIIENDDQKTWIFHGDILDNIIHKARWLAKTGAATYGLLTLINKILNSFLKIMGIREITIYKSIKSFFRKNSNEFTYFEKAVLAAARNKNCDTVICGHTHMPRDFYMVDNKSKIRYINCGDWVEHLTAAELTNNKWVLVNFPEISKDEPNTEADIPNKKDLYMQLYKEITFLPGQEN
jgi:UDP-2,3-diacylglucosamine pyrophosphatase LpxH